MLLWWQEGIGGFTLLHFAVKQRDDELFAYLVREPSVDVNRLTYERRTALDIACESDDRQTMIQRLRDAAAQHSRYFCDDSASSTSSSDRSL